MKKIIILFSLIFLSLHLFAKDPPKSFLNKSETDKIINDIQRIDSIERMQLQEVLEHINDKTRILGIQYYSVIDIEKLNTDVNPAKNLKYNSALYLLVNKAKDSVDNFGTYSLSNNKPSLFFNLDFWGKEFNESMFSILNFIEKSDWEKESVSIISIAGVQGFFVLYKDILYVPYRNRMVEFVEYFDQVESFYYRFEHLILSTKNWNKRIGKE